MSSKKKNKTAETIANEEVKKQLAKYIADRILQIKQKEAEIKKLRKEIEKIKSGELVPDSLLKNTVRIQGSLDLYPKISSPYQTGTTSIGYISGR